MQLSLNKAAICDPPGKDLRTLPSSRQDIPKPDLLKILVAGQLLTTWTILAYHPTEKSHDGYKVWVKNEEI